MKLPYQCRKEDSNLHPKLLRLGPEPSASASSAISAIGDAILTPFAYFDKRAVELQKILYTHFAAASLLLYVAKISLCRNTPSKTLG